MPVTGAILATAARDPGRVAIAAGEDRIGYAQLVEASRRVFAAVEALHRAQASPPAPAPEAGGIPITAVSLGSAFHAARLIASLAGFRAISATIDPLWPLEHRVHVIEASGIGVVIADAPELEPALRARGWGGTAVTLDEFLRLEAAAPPAEMPGVRDGEEPFLLLFSSGTTSNPKAFLKTRRQYRENFAVSSAHLEPLPGTATLAPGPVSYSLTLYALIECLASGGSAHLADMLEPAALAGRIRDERIGRVVAVPAVVDALSQAARRDPERFASLRLVVTGGANLSASLRAAWKRAAPEVRLISYYGAAEIGFIGDSRSGDGTLIDVYDSVGVQVRDDDGAPLPDGELGTVWVRAAACSDGYLAGTSRHRLKGADGWASVGDQGSMAAGRLRLAGRSGDIAVTGGHKVSLPEVERAFEGIPGLGAVCAVALPHPRLGSVVALIVEGASVDVARLRERARARLAPQFVPRRWYRVDALPRTVGGKIRRQAAAESVQRPDGAVRL